LLIETRAAATALAQQEQAVAAIRAAFAAGVAELPTGGADVTLLLAGPAVFAVVSKQTIQGEITWLSSTASLVVMLVLLYMFRSPTFLLLGMLPLLTGVITAALAVSLVYGSIHGITVAFGVTLLGVAIDYPTHAFAHAPSAGGLANGVRRVWRTLLLGLLTTVGGYLALVSPEFPGLTQLALFAASGLIAAALTTRWLLPALAPGLSPRWPTSRLQTIQTVGRPLKTTLIGVAVLIALSPLLTGYPPLQDDLAALSPIPADRLALDRDLRRGLGAPEVGSLLLITGSDAEAVLQRAEALEPLLDGLREDTVIAGFELVSRLLPSRAGQAHAQARLPARTELRRDLRQAMQGLPFKPDSFEPFLDAVRDSRALTPLTPSDLSGSLLGLRLSPLLYQRGDRWVALVPLYQVRDGAALRQAVEGLGLEGVYLVDVRRTSNAIVYRFLQETQSKLLIGGLLMVFFLVVALRDGRRLVSVLAPVILAIALDLVVLSWFEPGLNLFHLIALLLVAGLAVDYSLFFSRRPTGDQAQAESERAETSHAVSLCALSTFLMFAILAWSSLPVLHAIGITVAIGVALAYGLALLLAGSSDLALQQR